MIPVLAMIKILPSFAASVCTPHSFFFLPTWYEYLKTGPDPVGKCTPIFNFPNDIWAVGLAIVDILLRVAGFVAVISIMLAGVEYLSTMGNAEKGVAARKRVVNSIIGLVIVLIATGLVTFVGTQVGG
jgi:hypothetical protein